MLQMLGMVTAIRAPYTGKTLELRAEETSKAICKIAGTNDTVFKFLEKMLYVSDWIEVGKVISSVSVAAAIDFGVANEPGPVAMVIGGAASALIPDVLEEVAQLQLDLGESHAQEAA